MNINTKFDIGKMVVLKHDKQQDPRMITGISVRGDKLCSYNLLSGVADTWHYDFEIDEITVEKNKAGFLK